MAETFTCPLCGRTSHHPDDVRYSYCGACHEFTDTTGAVEFVKDLIAQGQWENYDRIMAERRGEV